MNYFNNNSTAHVIYKKTSDDKINFISFPFPSYFASINDFSQNFNVSTYLGNVSISELSSKLTSSVPSSGPYPLAVRYMDENYSIIERPPFQVKVDYSPTRSGRSRRNIKPVTIWIPWTVCVLNIQNPSYSKIFFNDSPIQSLDDVLILPWTSNVFQDGKVCLGESSRALHVDPTQDFDIYSWYHSFLNEYFFGGWNSDIYTYELNEFNKAAPNLFFFNYSSLKNITSHDIVDQSIVDKLKSSKIRFHSSSLYSFTMTNIYYNLSLLNLEQTLSLVTSIKECPQISNHKKISVSTLIKEQNNKNQFSFLFLENTFSASRIYSDSISININVKNNSYLLKENYSNQYYNSSIHTYIDNFLQNTKANINFLNVNIIKNYMKKHYQNKYVNLIERNSELILDSVLENIDNPIQTFNLEDNLTATYDDLEDFAKSYCQSLEENYI